MNPDLRAISVPIGMASARVAEGSATPPHPDVPPIFHTPSIDIHESPEGLILEADLPGVSEQQVAIQLEDNVLCLHARGASPAPEGARVLHEEFRPGDFYRSFILSDEVDRNRISAELKNGVLRLHLPKAERARSRKIEITTAK
jgi:HSP20 family molecular chaperone IbpA